MEPSDLTRPLQSAPSFEQWTDTTDLGIRTGIQHLLAVGAGGLVTTVSLDRYLTDDKAWEVLQRGIRIARDLGMRVWIRDEKGYPSGSGGGLVLAQMPDAEAKGLVRSVSPGGRVEFGIVRLYENSLAAVNSYENRRYINIIDPRAAATFLAVTHDRYERALHPIGSCVEAFFTEEPSLIPSYVPKGKNFPGTIPWHENLPNAFFARKGYQIPPHWESLFVDKGPLDRKIRCDFYEVLGDLCGEIFFGAIQDWCRDHGVSSSGHLFHEESLVWQTSSYGDPFACYRRLDIPGVEMNLSDPGKIMKEGFFLAPKIASSAARLQGKQRVVGDVCDVSGMDNGRHASMSQMKCTAGLLMSLGVTDLVSKYSLSLSPRQPQDLRPRSRRFAVKELHSYMHFVARVGKFLAEGQIERHVAVVYPLRTIWAHYVPSGRSIYEPHPNPLVRFVDEAFTNLCRDLLRQHIDFDVMDERSLVGATADRGTLDAGGQKYGVLVLPPMDTVSTGTMKQILGFVEQGGAVFGYPLAPQYAAEGPDKDAEIRAAVDNLLAQGGFGGSAAASAPIPYLIKSRIPPKSEFTPAAPEILCTTVLKKSGASYLLVNTASRPYTGRCSFRSIGQITSVDPETGKAQKIGGRRLGESTEVELRMGPYASRFIAFD